MAEATLPLPLDRKLYLHKNVDQESIGELSKKILEINENDKFLKKLYKIHRLKYKRKPIEIFIDTYGGDAYAIMGLTGVIEKSKTPIHTVATGAAMSCGFILLISGHKRFAYKHATPMYHQVASWRYGKLKDQLETIEETKRIQEFVETLTLKKTKIGADKLKENFEKKQNWYMSVEESLTLGVIDEII